MSFEFTELPAEIRNVVEQLVQVERSEKERLAAENRILREQIRLFQLEKYGPKSEQLSDRQLHLLDGEPCVSKAEVEKEAELAAKNPKAREPRTPKSDRQHPGRLALPVSGRRSTSVRDGVWRVEMTG
jgi:transposase